MNLTVTSGVTVDIPPPNARWCARRKAQVVMAILKEKLSLGAAMEVYRLSEEELSNWVALFQSEGVRGLRLTRCQDYRNNVKRRS